MGNVAHSARSAADRRGVLSGAFPAVPNSQRIHAPIASDVLDALADIVLAVRGDGEIVAVNAAAERAGWARHDWLGRNVLELLHPDDAILAASSLTTLQGKDTGTLIDVRVDHPTLGWRWFEVLGTDRLNDPTLQALVLTCRDTTERRRWEVARGDTARFQAIVDHAATVAMLVDRDGVVDSVSGAASRLLGRDPEHLVGRPLESLAAPGFESHLQAALHLARTPRRSEPVHREVPVEIGGSATLARYRFEIVNLCDDPVINGFVVTGHDVTELHEVRTALEETAMRDALTGLPSRAGLTEHLRTELWVQSSSSLVAVLLVDIDGFQNINDLDGHDVGDRLLRAVGQRLATAVRTGDVVARVGGDEFAIVASALPDPAAVDDLAVRVERLFEEPFPVGDHELGVTASVGVVTADPSSSVDSLLADADAAMRRVKRSRRHVSFAEPRAAAERRALARSLTDALARGEIEAWLQPILHARTQRLLGYESLVRWRCADGSVLGPGQFLDVAEELGLATAIDRVVLEQAVGHLAALHPEGDGPWVSVNMTAVDLANPALPAQLTELVAAHGLEPRRLAVEVTEHAMLEREAGMYEASPTATLDELARLGFRIVLDDFGTGYSSLTHVRTLHLHALKIDRSFISTITTSPADRSVVAAVVGLAKALRLTTVAEGVETAEQLAAVTALGCDAVQGWHFSRALPVGEMTAWLAARRAARSASA